MSSSTKIADDMAKGIGVFAISIGVFANVNPVLGNTFGLPTTLANSLFVPIFGGRNISLGAAILALSYLGNRQGLGVLISSCVIAGLVDVAVCVRVGTSVVSHLLGTAVFVGVGVSLLR